MGRFRTLTRTKETLNYTQYNERIDGLETLKFARSIEGTDKRTVNFALCGNAINTFRNQETLIELKKAQALNGPHCNGCPDVPVTLHNGLQSEICYNEFFNTINDLERHPCKCVNLHKLDLCKERSGKLYEYGHFNNNRPDVNYNLHRKLVLCCQEREPCPVYVFCKCPPQTKDCKCCDYTVTFPFQDKFLHYTVSGCTTKRSYNKANNPHKNPAKSYRKYLAQKSANEIIEDLSFLDFSKFQAEC